MLYGASTSQSSKGELVRINNQGGRIADPTLGDMSPEPNAARKRGQDGNLKVDGSSLKEGGGVERGIQLHGNQEEESSNGDMVRDYPVAWAILMWSHLQRSTRARKRFKTDGTKNLAGHSPKITSFFPKQH